MAAIGAMWNNSQDGTSTMWTNTGNGNFDDLFGTGWVNANSGTFNPNPVSLPNLDISRGNYYSSGGSNSIGLLGQAMYHTYSNSPYYEQWQADRRTKNLDEFQSGLDYLGTVPLLGEPVDLVNGIMSAVRGNYTDAGLSVAAMLPIAGVAATAIKIQKHHIIPQAVYRDAGKAVQEALDLNGGFNLKKIPTPFHGNHPQYNIYVTNQLENLKNITPGSIQTLQKDLNGLINKAYDNYKATGENLNDYFRQINKK